MFSLQWIHELLTAVHPRVIASELLAVFLGFCDQVTVAEILIELATPTGC